MKKQVKCLLLKVDTVLITEIIEVGSELGEPDCKLINPYRFLVKMIFVGGLKMLLTKQNL
jgi:hypothetical protein